MTNTATKEVPSMIEYVNRVPDPESPWLEIQDSEENILNHLAEHTLDPVYERYGNFVNRNPKWLHEEGARKYGGCTTIFGNFLNFSHAFYLITDDEALISRLSEAIDRNKARPEYQAAREKLARNGWHWN